MLLMSTAAELEANENVEVTSVFTPGKSFRSTIRETQYIHFNGELHNAEGGQYNGKTTHQIIYLH